MGQYWALGYLAAAMLLGTGAFAAGAAAPTASTGQPLFNGVDLAGWTGYLDKRGRNSDGKLTIGDVFRVDRATGVIHVDGKGVPYGYIRTAKSYTNFRLHVEWRWLEAAMTNNSGILLRATGGGADQVHGMYYEVETAEPADAVAGPATGDLIVVGYDKASLVSDPARISPWGANMDGYQGFSWKGAVRKRSTDAEKPTGQWNSYDVSVDGGHITVRLNGILINEATGAQVIPGGIALQVAGAPIDFPNVVVTRLDR